mgnify:CR=1 FL=1
MVKRRKHPQVRVHPKYFDFAASIRNELEPKLHRRISDRELTGSLLSFMEEENLTPIFVRRKRKKGGWL